MRSLRLSKLNPVNKFSETPEAFLVEHCGNLVKTSGGMLDERILFFVRRLAKLKIRVPALDIRKFPPELHTEKIKKMCSYSVEEKAA